MKLTCRPLLYLFFALVSFSAKAQILTFSFSGNTGDESTFPSTANAGGVLPSVISRGSGVTAALSGDRYNSINWTTAPTIDVTNYIEFTITPLTGYAADISHILLYHRRSTNGPLKFVMRTSLNNFATNATSEVTIADVNRQQNHSFAFFTPIHTTTPVTIRIYAYASQSLLDSWGPGEMGDDITVFGSSEVLPIKFINIKAVKVNNSVKVDWTNAVESNVKEYIVEHCTDAQNFTAIGSAAPQKNDGQEATYTHLHHQPSNGVNYYRIKGIEKNGTVMYSIVVKVNAEFSSPTPNIFPNPIKGGELKFSLANLTAGVYSIIVYNSAGQTIKRESVKHTGGSYTTAVPLHSVSKGMYFLEITGAINLHERFIVQ